MLRYLLVCPSPSLPAVSLLLVGSQSHQLLVSVQTGRLHIPGPFSHRTLHAPEEDCRPVSKSLEGLFAGRRVHVGLLCTYRRKQNKTKRKTSRCLQRCMWLFGMFANINNVQLESRQNYFIFRFNPVQLMFASCRWDSKKVKREKKKRKKSLNPHGDWNRTRELTRKLKPLMWNGLFSIGVWKTTRV